VLDDLRGDDAADGRVGKRGDIVERVTSSPRSRATATMPSFRSTPRARTPAASSAARNSPRPQPRSTTSDAPAKIGKYASSFAATPSSDPRN